MATYSKDILSGSTHGRGIKVAATSIASGTTVHTAVNSTTDIDLVTLFGQNNHTAAVTLTLGWGGTTDPDDLIVLTIQPKTGLALLVADQPLRNNLEIRAAASDANKVVIFGYVNKIRA